MKRRERRAETYHRCPMNSLEKRRKSANTVELPFDRSPLNRVAIKINRLGFEEKNEGNDLVVFFAASGGQNRRHHVGDDGGRRRGRVSSPGSGQRL